MYECFVWIFTAQEKWFMSFRDCSCNVDTFIVHLSPHWVIRSLLRLTFMHKGHQITEPKWSSRLILLCRLLHTVMASSNPRPVSFSLYQPVVPLLQAFIIEWQSHWSPRPRFGMIFTYVRRYGWIDVCVGGQVTPLGACSNHIVTLRPNTDWLCASGASVLLALFATAVSEALVRRWWSTGATSYKFGPYIYHFGNSQILNCLFNIIDTSQAFKLKKLKVWKQQMC